MLRFALISLACGAALGLAGCSDGASSSNDLTGTSSAERPVTFTSYVYVDQHEQRKHYDGNGGMAAVSCKRKNEHRGKKYDVKCGQPMPVCKRDRDCQN